MNDLNGQQQQFVIAPMQFVNAPIDVSAIEAQYSMMHPVYQTEPPKIETHQNGNCSTEKERIANRLGSFNPKDNQVWRQITQRFGATIKHQELLSIANVLAQNANIKLDRDAKRRKSVLIKWFEENWAAIYPFLNYVVLEDAN